MRRLVFLTALLALLVAAPVNAGHVSGACSGMQPVLVSESCTFTISCPIGPVCVWRIDVGASGLGFVSAKATTPGVPGPWAECGPAVETCGDTGPFNLPPGFSVTFTCEAMGPAAAATYGCSATPVFHV